MAQQKTLFDNIVKLYMPFAGGVKKPDTTNESNEELNYLHQSMLTEEYSVDLTWGSKSFNNVRVKADIVALDSPLPVKRRPSLGAAKGDIVKSGMKKWLGEKEINQIMLMESQGADEEEIARKIFDDLNACRDGILESNEYNFLKALSGGQILIPDEDNAGLGIRISFDLPEDNVRGVPVVWSDTDADAVEDIQLMLDKISDDGNSASVIITGRKAYQRLRKSYGAKRLHAEANNLEVGLTSPLPNKAQFDQEFYDEFGLSITVVDRTVRTEINGMFVNEKPFDEEAVVFLPSNTVGRLVYGRLAEEARPVNGVIYNKPNSYTLLSKYSKNDPLREFSASQALVLPVLDNTEQMYILNTELATTVEEP